MSNEGWSRMDLKEFHESGLLAQVNAATLWPLGLALTVLVDRQEDGEVYKELFVQRLDPYDVIVAGDSPEDNEARMNRLADWMRKRLGGNMAQYSAVIRKTNGDAETSLIEAQDDSRAQMIAEEMAKSVEGELISVTAVTASPPEAPLDTEPSSEDDGA